MGSNRESRSPPGEAGVWHRVAAASRATVAVCFGAIAGTIVVVSVVIVCAFIALDLASLGGDAAERIAIRVGLLSLLVGLIAGPIWGGLWVGIRLNRDSNSVENDSQVSVSGTRENVTVVCPNCGAKKYGRFCGACGQNDRDYRRLIPALSEVVAETFEADSRVWRTLRALLFRPGFLSLEFARNRRAGYISPFRLYLFASVPYFLIISYIDNLSQPNVDEGAVVDADSATTSLSDQMPHDLLYEYLPLMALVILPLYASLLQFIFIGRRMYAESFVFVLHFMTINFLILLVFSPWMVDQDASDWQYFAFLLPLGIYLLFGLKRFYGAGWMPTTAGWFAALMIYIVLFFAAVLGTDAAVGFLAG